MFDVRPLNVCLTKPQFRRLHSRQKVGTPPDRDRRGAIRRGVPARGARAKSCRRRCDGFLRKIENCSARSLKRTTAACTTWQVRCRARRCGPNRLPATAEASDRAGTGNSACRCRQKARRAHDASPPAERTWVSRRWKTGGDHEHAISAARHHRAPSQAPEGPIEPGAKACTSSRRSREATYKDVAESA